MGGTGLPWPIPVGAIGVVIGVGVGGGGAAFPGIVEVIKNKLLSISDAMVIAVSKKVFFIVHLHTTSHPTACASAAAKRAQRAERVGCNRLLASAPFFKTLSSSCVSVFDFYEAHAVTQLYRSVQRSTPLLLAFTFCRVAHSRLRQTRAFGFVNLPARCRVASHAPLCRRSYAQCHTAQVVSRDVGFRPAVPLPAVAILSHVLLEQTRLFAFCKA
jgi:hypothetical protein